MRKKNIQINKVEKSLEIFTRFVGLCSLSLIVLSLSSIILGRYNYLLDLFSHFQLQYFALFTLALTILIVRRLRNYSLLTGGYMLFLAIILIFPVDINSVKPQNTQIYFQNVNYFQDNSKEIVEEIERANPDTVVLVEVGEQYIEKLKPTYGEPLSYQKDGALSCVIFSKNGVKEAGVLTDTAYPICYAHFEQYSLVAIHPVPPLTLQTAQLMDQYFDETEKYLDQLEDQGRQYILVGDFNSTVYSGVFRKYFGGLHKKNIYSWQATSLLALPIDHALSKSQISVSRSEQLGSDHRALYINYLGE